MTQRRRRARTAAIGALLALVVAAATGTAGAASASHASHGPARGFSVVQYAATGPQPLPWNAHLLGGANLTLTTASGPRSAPDAEGGVQVTFRNPEGDAIWMDGASVGHFHNVDLTALTGIPPLAGAPTPSVGPDGLDHVFCVATTGHLYELTWDPYLRIPSRIGLPINRYDLWRTVDLTAIGGPEVTGAPSVVVDGTTTDVFARTAAGDLVEYTDQGIDGEPWSAYDLTVESGGPRVSSDPVAVDDATSGEVRVAATERGPVHGDVVVFTPNDVGGRVWSFLDVSKATSTSPVTAGLAATMDSGQLLVFGAGPTGDLMQYVGTDSGVTTSWESGNLTTTTEGAPQISGTPSVALSGTKLVVAAVAAGWGDLFEWAQASPRAAFTVTDVSITGQGPARTVAGTPAAAFWGGRLSLFGAGVGVPAPEGTGVYAIPYDKLSQAVKDGWPALGDTGGLGTQCAPWVGYPTPESQTSAEPDEFEGQAIQASHVRETWLSFWTVSGPGTQAGPGCTRQKPPYTPSVFYAHGFAAGKWVAAQIDGYRGAGLGLKPDWVIFDPEGYPDNHSGLWGPTSTPAELHRSVADWYAMLAGWKNGIAAVDPSLKAALYANQYEYTTYELSGQPLPTFIAGAFSEQRVHKKLQLVAPTRSAFGPNIRGFVMFNENFTPTCTQVNDERLVLTAAPWNGDYNTIQITAGKYCAPGPAPG